MINNSYLAAIKNRSNQRIKSEVFLPAFFG